MYEIELKAHVDDPDSVAEKLEFAEFLESVKKEDVYWGIVKDGKKVEARIRKEIGLTENKNKFVFTYKKKESFFDENGNRCEVNDEMESELSDGNALESFFVDLGLEVLLKKEKTVKGYRFGECHIELCEVPPLGWFLEIEIIAENNDEKTVAEKKAKIMEIFEKCGIDESKIESRYYSDMLKSYKYLGN